MLIVYLNVSVSVSVCVCICTAQQFRKFPFLFAIAGGCARAVATSASFRSISLFIVRVIIRGRFAIH